MVTECGHKVTKLKQTKNERFDQVRIRQQQGEFNIKLRL